jgi:hypothetical protein
LYTSSHFERESIKIREKREKNKEKKEIFIITLEKSWYPPKKLVAKSASVDTTDDEVFWLKVVPSPSGEPVCSPLSERRFYVVSVCVILPVVGSTPPQRHGLDRQRPGGDHRR